MTRDCTRRVIASPLGPIMLEADRAGRLSVAVRFTDTVEPGDSFTASATTLPTSTWGRPGNGSWTMPRRRSANTSEVSGARSTSTW